MPRFFFDYRDSTTTARDDVGLDLGGTNDAIVQAKRALAEAMADDSLWRGADGDARIAIAIDVRDATGTVVHTAVMMAADLKVPVFPGTEAAGDQD